MISATAKRRVLLSVLAIQTAAMTAACGGGRPSELPAARTEPTTAPAPSTVPVAIVPPVDVQKTEVQSAAPAETTQARAYILTADASTVQRLFDDTRHAAAAVLKPKGATGADPLAKGLRELAKRAAPGMQPDGPLATGDIKEKQNVQTDITLQPGKCYAILGFSGKVRDLDLYLLLPPGILSGQDTTDDNLPVIGGPPQPMCPVATTPVTYKLDIVADRGAGEVAVQLYSRAH